MSENSNQTNPDRTVRSAEVGMKYLGAVGVLLVIVIGLLGLLWVKEHRLRIASESRTAELRNKYSGLESVLGDVLTGGGPGMVPIRRDSLPTSLSTRKVDFENRQQTVFEMDASMGRQMGLRPGDLILIVEEPPTSQPTTDR